MLLGEDLIVELARVEILLNSVCNKTCCQPEGRFISERLPIRMFFFFLRQLVSHHLSHHPGHRQYNHVLDDRKDLKLISEKNPIILNHHKIKLSINSNMRN